MTSTHEGNPPTSTHETRRCTARTSAGRSCRNYAIRGGNVCRVHGGSAPAVRAAANRRLEARRVELEAAELVGRAGTTLHPIEHLADALARSYAIVDVLAGRLQGERLVDAEGLHPLWPPFERERDRHARLAKLCLDAGIDERRVRIAEEDGAAIVDAINGALVELGVDPTDLHVRQTLAAKLRAAGRIDA